VTEVAAELRARLDAAGLGAGGVLDVARYDALVPPAWRAERVLLGARSVVVVASGGRAFWEAFCASPEASRGPHPVDAFARRVLGETVEALEAASHAARALHYDERRGGEFADFVALGRAAGLGAPSRLGLLLHPIYGPWLSIRAVLLTALDLDESPALTGFDPCQGCPAPCATACHGAAVPPTGFDAAGCAATRRSEPACALRCDARRACVVGRAHAYAPEQEAHHAAAAVEKLVT
jgi:hypothetical protein